MAKDGQDVNIADLRGRPIGRVLVKMGRVTRTQVHEALEVMKRYKISGVPVTREGKAVGILTNRDLRFVGDTHQEPSKVQWSIGILPRKTVAVYQHTRR